MDDDEYTMTCEHCGHTWDGYAQCQCSGNMGGNIQYKEIENLEFYQKLYENLNTLKARTTNILHVHLIILTLKWYAQRERI